MSRHHGIVQALLRTIGVLGQQAHPGDLPARLRGAAAGPARGPARHRRHRRTHGGSSSSRVRTRGWPTDAYELIVSLGYRCGWTSEAGARAASAESSTAYILTFTTVDDVFRLRAQAAAPQGAAPRSTVARRAALHHRRQAGRVACRCDASRSTTTTTSTSPAASMIPTHNSTLGLDFARSASIKHNLASADLLAGDEPHRDHHAAAVGRGADPAAPACATASMSDDDWTKLAREHGRDLRGAALHRRHART